MYNTLTVFIFIAYFFKNLIYLCFDITSTLIHPFISSNLQVILFIFFLIFVDQSSETTLHILCTG